MYDERMSGSIRRASLALVILLSIVAVAAGYWQVATSAALVSRQDNPRLVLAELQIPRGAILDRNGQPLAVSVKSPEGYSRYYPERSAAPVIGYSSLRYGVGGIEATFDSDLRGTRGLTFLDKFTNRLLHRVPAGRSVRLTLDISLQRAADTALGDQAGAIVVLSVPDGDVRALVSHPTFDPARLDQDWEHLSADPASPLINRVTQGSYQPGAAFQAVLLAEALSKRAVLLTDTLAVETVPAAVVNGQSLGCATSPLSNTLAASFAAACPAEFAEFMSKLDSQSVADAIRRWKLDTPPVSFELPAQAPEFAFNTVTTTLGLRDTILGQGSLTVSPLQMASVIGTIANGGRSITPLHLTPRPAPESTPPAILDSPVANALRSAFPVRDDLAGQTALAIGGDNRLVWFLGYLPSPSPRWAMVILLENSDVTTAGKIADVIAAFIHDKLTP